jgi:tetratricopeptide (TPR) repeat protein
MRRWRCGWLILAALMLASAAPVDLVRAGNAAFREGDYDRALDLFSRAEELIADPGLVARNKAAAYYRLGQYRQAELHYVRGLEGAEGERRANLLYDLGNAVLQQASARKNDVKLFDRAIGMYQECLHEESAGEKLREDARHNLKIAQTLRAQAKPGEERDPDPDRKTTPEDDPKRSGERTGSSANDVGVREDPSGKIQSIGERELGKEAKTSQRPTPGTGNLEPIPDDDVLKRLPPEEAAEHLRRAANRIVSERKEARKAPVVKGKNVLNW